MTRDTQSTARMDGMFALAGFGVMGIAFCKVRFVKLGEFMESF